MASWSKSYRIASHRDVAISVVSAWYRDFHIGVVSVWLACRGGHRRPHPHRGCPPIACEAPTPLCPSLHMSLSCVDTCSACLSFECAQESAAGGLKVCGLRCVARAPATPCTSEASDPPILANCMILPRPELPRVSGVSPSATVLLAPCFSSPRGSLREFCNPRDADVAARGATR